MTPEAMLHLLVALASVLSYSTFQIQVAANPQVPLVYRNPGAFRFPASTAPAPLRPAGFNPRNVNIRVVGPGGIIPSALGPGAVFSGVVSPDGYLDPNAASQSPLGSILRHTNAIPNSPLDFSELVDVSALVPAPLGPVAASLVLSPIFSTVANGLTNFISNSAIQGDPLLFQRRRAQYQYQYPVSPRFQLYLDPRPVTNS